MGIILSIEKQDTAELQLDRLWKNKVANKTEAKLKKHPKIIKYIRIGLSQDNTFIDALLETDVVDAYIDNGCPSNFKDDHVEKFKNEPKNKNTKTTPKSLLDNKTSDDDNYESSRCTESSPNEDTSDDEHFKELGFDLEMKKTKEFKNVCFFFFLFLFSCN